MLPPAVPAATGLTVIVDPVEPTLDVIFVHGFTGHPERTWTHKRGDAKPGSDDNDEDLVEPPSKTRRLNPFSRQSHESISSRTAIYWPRDLLRVTIPNARVMVYGYDTHVRHFLGPPVSRNTVYDIAWDFLVAIETERRTDPSRPILFVVHSLGGIVVKEMLRRSSNCHLGQTHLNAIFESTIGIMFFGTPHSGADPRGFLQHIAEKAIKAAGFQVNEQVVNTLLPSAERLRELREEFSPMALRQNWIIHSFQEQLGVKVLSGHKVVEDTSSYLNAPIIETTEHIGRNHMDMCRFTSLEDVEYKKVAAALHRMARAITPRQKEVGIQSLNQDQRQILLDSLRFDQIDSRRLTIKNAHAKTCRWLLKIPQYLDWLDPSKLTEHHGLLWINGKPGAGKSTLMKFALLNAKKTMKENIILSFFFNARGDDLEKSTIGMYRSLLLQLLERLPELQCVFDSLELMGNGYHQWSVEALKALFEQAVQSLGPSPVACFIDALDECDERQVRDMVSFFEHVCDLAVSAKLRFRVCFSSRPYPHVSTRRGYNLVLEGHEGHTQDISDYINGELKIGRSKLADEIRIELQEKASGVFMWIVLVVDILNEEYDHGRLHALRKRLQDIPRNLHELFRDILTRDCHNADELLLCIQWVLYARRPLKPEQLYYAILSGSAPDTLSLWHPDEVTSRVINQFVLNSSKGLAEVTKSQNPTVQFIHESVKDFLIKENGLNELWPNLGGNLQGQSHERLKHCCLEYMHSGMVTHLQFPLDAVAEELTKYREAVRKEFPFLEYATQNVLYHAEAAEVGGIDQSDFVQIFRLADWTNNHNIFERYEARRYHGPSLLYVLAENNTPALIRAHPSSRHCFDEEDERYGTPIFAALSTGSHDAVLAFLEVLTLTHSSVTQLDALYQEYCDDAKSRAKFDRKFTFSRKKSVLFQLIERDDEIILEFFLVSYNVNMEWEDSSSRTPLLYAAMFGHQNIVKLLLDKGANIESKDSNSRTPLSLAAVQGDEAIVELLVQHGADIESKDSLSKTPLSWATVYRRQAIVKLLLEKGADVESKDYNSRTPLSLAARQGDEAIVELLVQYGADIESKDSASQTPRSWAARGGHRAIVELLQEYPKD